MGNVSLFKIYKRLVFWLVLPATDKLWYFDSIVTNTVKTPFIYCAFKWRIDK